MSKLIKKLKIDNKLRILDIAFADFETILSEENNHIVISYAIADKNEKIKSKYIAHGENIKDQSMILVREFVEACIGNYSIVYMHNGSGFDFTFILNYLSKDSNNFKIKCLAKNLTFYSITIIDKKTECELEFRDSYQLMTMSLKEVGNIFFNNKKN